MLLKDLIRIATQHRTLYCYYYSVLLLIWILLLIAGISQYVGQNAGSLSFFNRNDNSYTDATKGESEEVKRLRLFKERCTSIERIARKEDGGILEGWKLQGVLLVIRHGDRGPMSHVRAVEKIDCGVGITFDPLVNKYRSFLHNSSSLSGANHMYWNKVGPFHGFALLPSSEKVCQLGQLTYKGIAQLLHVGDILHQIYAYPLGLFAKPASARVASATTPHSLLNSDEVVLYSTRYRRTFQSAMALLYSFLPPDKWLALNVRESHSMGFCFTDCACQHAEVLRKVLAKRNGQYLAQHSSMTGVIQWVGSTLLQHTPNGINDPNEVVDAMLTVLCHDAKLPCRQVPVNSSQSRIPSTPSTAIDLGDVINIDQDDTMPNIVDLVPDGSVHDDEKIGLSTEPVGCIETAHVMALMSFANWQSAREANHAHYKRLGLLRAYGMMRHIVSYMLKIISGDRTKFVLYSGHDWTLQFLTAALGLEIENTFIAYAARLAFELYKSETHPDYYFRLVYNGHDVTREIDFCEGGKSLRVTRDSRGNKADLCPIENIIRFLHEDYFSSLNATNFKDACSVPQKGSSI